MVIRRLVGGGLAASAVLAFGTAMALPASAHDHGSRGRGPIGGYDNIVVIYQENHSFDNLYGEWGKVGRDWVDGRRSIKQVAQDGSVYNCLLQNDVNLTSPTPLSTRCTDEAKGVAASHFRNRQFPIDKYISRYDTTCPEEGVSAPNGVLKGKGLPGGCTRDLVHRFYQEQYQLNGGQQNRYVTGSDAVGLTMGYYNTQQLPIYQYLHSAGAPNYVVADRFFQAAFGGSFLNHQYLIAARAPVDTSNGTLSNAGAMAKYSVLDSNGMPTSYPLYKATRTDVVDGQLTQKCTDGKVYDYAKACGSIAVNTVQPASQPYGKGAQIPLIDDKEFPNIGDRLSDKGISWNWYSGGWDAADSGKPGANFQYHHQPFNYFANYAKGQPGRAHLQDETKFFDAAKNGSLPRVSFVKPYGNENEHPGYASAADGSDHLVKLLKAVMTGPQAKKTLVVVTYDEFGGQYDHVAPPKGDAWGPGTRIPALVLSANMNRSGVDHTTYDTTSIMATIEKSFGLAPVASRDASATPLNSAINIGSRRR